mgnify:CR=1 FL=1
MARNAKIEGVEKTYGERKALDNISLDIEGRRILALVGLNGSGKTTLLRIVSGLDEPTSGSILVDDRRMQGQELRRIATMIFQRTVMFNASVFENVAFGLRVRGFTKAEVEKRVSQALVSVGLTGFERRRAKKLSGGEQQRVALARAFAINPEIFLLDEPTANLDPASAIGIENIIREMRERETRAVILSTHNLHQARRLADKIAHIHYGRILEVAKPDRFFTNPSNEVTRRFVNGELQF